MSAIRSLYRVAQVLSREKGISLIETLVAIAIVAVLFSLAAPNFADSVHRYRVNALRDELIMTMQWARTEALRRGVPIIMRRLETCTVSLTDADDWRCGWSLVVDQNRNGIADSAEPILQKSSAAPEMTITHTAQGSSLVINRFGAAETTPQKFVLSSGAGGARATTVCLGAGGQLKKFSGSVACS